MSSDAATGDGAAGDADGRATSTIRAWFSADFALRHGSSVRRKPDGSTVNVTRMSDSSHS